MCTCIVTGALSKICPEAPDKVWPYGCPASTFSGAPLSFDHVSGIGDAQLDTPDAGEDRGPGTRGFWQEEPRLPGINR